MKSAGLAVKLAPQPKPLTDVVGLEVGASYPDGVPAVRIRKQGERTELVAAGFLRLPGQLPENAAAAAETPPVWSLPPPYQAPYAALAVSAPEAFLRHTTGTGEDDAESGRTPLRTAARAYGPDLPTFKAGMPEYQAAWAARLFPEGHQPTACSLQVSSAAAVNTFSASPLLNTLGGTTLVLFVFQSHASLVAFHDSQITLYREHPVGYGHVRAAISDQMRVEAPLADSVLQDSFIDPVPMMEPVLKPLLRQIEISSDYLLRRRNCKIERFFLCGLPSGTKHWSTLFAQSLNMPIQVFHPFDGLLKSPRATDVPGDIVAVEPYLSVALGAARAVLEDR